MGEVVTLNQVRKARAKAEAKSRAESNRIAFGRTKAEKEAARRVAERQKRDLDGKKAEE